MQTWMTHQIQNQFDELQDYNLFETDTVLQEILTRYGSQDQTRLSELGAHCSIGRILSLCRFSQSAYAYFTCLRCTWTP